MKKEELVRRWRKCKLPRLYWRSAHPRWRWDSGVVARFRDGAAVTLFLNLGAIAEFMAECNCGEK